MEKLAKIYSTPLIEVNEVVAESGFVISGYGDDSDDSEFGTPSYY